MVLPEIELPTCISIITSHCRIIIIHKGFPVAKTLLGQSSVFVSVPPNCKLFEFGEWSVIVFPIF